MASNLTMVTVDGEDVPVVTWSDQSHRQPRKVTRNRKRGTSTTVRFGDKIRPEPTEPCDAPGMVWPDRPTSPTDAGKVLVYGAIVTSGDAVIVESSTEGPKVPKGELRSIRNADGSLPTVARKLPVRTMAALIARDAAVIAVDAAQRASLPKRTRSTASTARAVATRAAATAGAIPVPVVPKGRGTARKGSRIATAASLT